MPAAGQGEWRIPDKVQEIALVQSVQYTNQDWITSGSSEMTKSTIRSMVLGIMVAAVGMPLHAQMMADPPSPASQPAEAVARVRTDGGVIMLSEDGAEFKTAAQGERVGAKTRLMVSQESSATVIYDDGCKRKYADPGIYDISPTCALPVAAASGGGSKGVIVAAAIFSTVALYEIYDHFQDNDNGPPISR